MEEGDDVMSCWIYGGKRTCKNVSTPTLKLVFERGNQECDIASADISYLGIDV
jgi:hypothetical protein